LKSCWYSLCLLGNACENGPKIQCGVKSPFPPYEVQDDAVFLALKLLNHFHDICQQCSRACLPSTAGISSSRRPRYMYSTNNHNSLQCVRPSKVEARRPSTAVFEVCALLIIIPIMMRYISSMNRDRTTGQPSGLDISKMSLTGS